MKTLSIKLPPTLAARVNVLARKRKTTKSALVREAMEMFLASQDQARPGSVLDRVQDLVGCIEGPGDLSFNKEHLRDFGR